MKKYKGWNSNQSNHAKFMRKEKKNKKYYKKKYKIAIILSNLK